MGVYISRDLKSWRESKYNPRFQKSWDAEYISSVETFDVFSIFYCEEHTGFMRFAKHCILSLSTFYTASQPFFFLELGLCTALYNTVDIIH